MVDGWLRDRAQNPIGHVGGTWNLEKMTAGHATFVHELRAACAYVVSALRRTHEIEGGRGFRPSQRRSPERLALLRTAVRSTRCRPDLTYDRRGRPERPSPTRSEWPTSEMCRIST